MPKYFCQLSLVFNRTHHLNYMLNIIAHRGYWDNPQEKNTSEAFLRAFENNFGIETDFREFSGQLVIGHDLPGPKSMLADDLIAISNFYSSSNFLAINVKADGLSILIKNFISKLNHNKYFAFDMSVTDYRSYFKAEVPVFTRMSEYENPPVFFDQTAGIWLDSFDRVWFDSELIAAYLRLGKHIAIVSPELHGRDYCELWHFLKKYSFHLNPLISICTDHPSDAREFFYG